MCELTFGRADIERWARFSGDYNPIHFDPARARRLGAAGVIAHGMLVLLAVKGRAAAALPPGGGWWLLRARLRQPVLAGKPVLLELRRQGEIAFSLVSEPGRKLLTGTLAPLGGAPAPAAPGTRHRLGPEAVAARVRELNEAFPWPAELWVAADAVVFAESLRTAIRDVLAPHGIDLGRADDGGKVVVQTAHEVAFDRDFFGAGTVPAAAWDIDVLPPQAEAVEGGVFATCQLVSRCEGRVVMLTSLGLFIRPAPEGAFSKE